jgi:DNA-binding response OmpR family regulator
MPTLNHILIVDDDAETCNLLRLGLAPLGCELAFAYDGPQAMQLLETGSFNLAILDLMLPRLSGVQVLRHAREKQPATDIIVLTAFASLGTAIEALRLGAYDYVSKPFHLDDMRATVRRALEKQHMTKRLATVYDLNHEMAFSLNMDQIVATVIDIVTRVLEFNICGVWLIDREQNELYCAAAYGFEEQKAARFPLDNERGIIAAVARSGEMLYLSDTREDYRYIDMGTTSRSELAVPLQVKGRVVGVLNVESAETNAFSPADLQLFSILATQAAVAIENAQSYEKAQQEIAEIKRAEEALRATKAGAEAAIRALRDGGESMG